jgi:hypothetical protein
MIVMAWKIDIQLDDGREDCGSITATWTEEDGRTFVFPMRHLCSEEARPKFMVLAEAALLKWRGKATIEKPIATAMTASANRVK